jgi:uncharacterized protein (TIGR00369 family)
MELEAVFNRIPFHKLLGIEITEATDGYAEGRLPFSDDLLSNPTGEVAHGGATYALADSVGGAAVISLSGAVSPTVDMRVDYLAPATTDLYAEAEVIRDGQSLAMTRVEVTDDEGRHVATAHATYKIDGQGTETPWGDRSAVDEEVPEGT